MSRENGIHQPWDSIKGFLSVRPAESSIRRRHPSRRILRAYIGGSLPERPSAWTKERAERLAKGKLSDWTRVEVAAHVADCPRCRAQLEALKAPETARRASVFDQLRYALAKPRWATVGWSLAGAQAAVLVGLLVWSGFFANPETQTGKPISFPLLNGISEFHSSSDEPALWVQFSAQAPWSEVTSWLQSLGVEVVGPDDKGRYLVVGEDITRDLLEASPWVAYVESVAEEGEKP